jgi:hypothetical protein
MISVEQIEAIINAIKLIQMTPDVKKIEGKGWKVYQVGLILRVDIEDVF